MVDGTNLDGLCEICFEELKYVVVCDMCYKEVCEVCSRKFRIDGIEREYCINCLNEK